jgi:hypothetical protein
MSRAVIGNHEREQKRIQSKSIPHVSDFLNKKVNPKVDKQEYLTSDEKAQVKHVLSERKDALVVNTTSQAISLLVLPGDLQFDKRRMLSEELAPMFESFYDKVKNMA